MPILSYVPPVKNIIDHRSPDGGYYVAKCEVCGGEFYPKRSNAKYDTSNCALIAHRTAIANGTSLKQGGTVLKKSKETPKPTNRPRNHHYQIVGAKNVHESLMECNNIFARRKAWLIQRLKIMDVGQEYKTDGIIFTRHSQLKWSWKQAEF